MPILLGIILVEGSLFEVIEENVEVSELFPNYDNAMKSHKLFTNMVKEQIRDNEDQIDYETLLYLDSNNKRDMLGFYVEKNKEEIYRSTWMKGATFEYDEYEDLEIINYEGIFVMNDTEVLTINNTYRIYTYYNFEKANDVLSKYAGYILLAAVSIFALFTFLLILWVFRHIRTSMKQLVAMTQSILVGDLKTPVPYNQKDEFRELADTINTLRSELYDSKLEKKEHLEKERERMLANIAHDIKTPITAIKGCAQMLSEDIINDEKTKKDYLDIIVSRSHVIEHMVNDLKEVIKYDVGSIKLNFANVKKMGYFIDDCIDDFRINNQKKQDFEISFEKKYEDLVLSIDQI